MDQTDRLSELIADKRTLLEQLRDLARRQGTLIDQGQITGLLSLLAAKQRLLGDLQRVERQLDPFRGQDPDQRLWRTAADRQRCRQQAERCEALLTEIMLLEKQGESDLAARRDEAARQLLDCHHAAHATRAYTAVGLPAQGELDLSSEE